METEGVVVKNLHSGLRSVSGPLQASVTFDKSFNLPKSRVPLLSSVGNCSTGIRVLLGFQMK